jgi:ABC-type phosphate/phosphonate transport system permease subunit
VAFAVQRLPSLWEMADTTLLRLSIRLLGLPLGLPLAVLLASLVLRSQVITQALRRGGCKAHDRLSRKRHD